MSFHWSPIARTAPSGTPSRRASQRTARPFDTPGATNSMKCGWLTVTSASPAKRARASGATSVGSGGSPWHMTFVTGWRIEATRSSSRSGRWPMNVVYSSARGSSDRMMNRSRWLTCGSSPCARVQTTTSRATAADSGVWMSSRPGRVDAGCRHLADERALVADERRVEVELAREAERARDHPAGDERDDDAALAGRADRRTRVRPDHEVVADERAVDVEGDHGDGQDRVGRHDVGHATMMPDRRSARWRAAQPRATRATRGSPARSGSTAQDQPGRRVADPLHDRLALVRPDLERARPRRRPARPGAGRAGAR